MALAGVYLAFTEITAPSVASVFGMKGTMSFSKAPLRLIGVHLILIGFFTMIFSLAAEWIGIVLDNEVALFGVAAFIIFALIHHRYTHFMSLFTIPLDFIEEFYQKFIEMITYRKKILLVICGMLILHLLAEIGTNGLSVSFGLREDLYNADFEEHSPLFSIVPWAIPWSDTLYAVQTSGLTILSQFFIAIAYLLNIFALLALMALPVILWAHMYHYQDKPLNHIPSMKLPDWFTALFVSSLFVLFTRPALKVLALHREFLVGVDITTQSIALTGLLQVLMAALAVAIITYFVSRHYHDIAKRIVYTLGIVGLYYYFVLFAASISSTYQQIIGTTFKESLLISVYLILFLIFNIVLYVGGSIALIIELYLRREVWFESFHSQAIADWFIHHHLPHIHFFSSHDHALHGAEDARIKTFILESIDAGHELYVAVNHLVEKGWRPVAIDEAIESLSKDPLYKKHFIHIGHKMHKQKYLHKLQLYIHDRYLQQKQTFQEIYDASIKAGWTDDDIAYGFKGIEFRESDKEIAKYLLRVRKKG